MPPARSSQSGRPDGRKAPRGMWVEDDGQSSRQRVRVEQTYGYRSRHRASRTEESSSRAPTQRRSRAEEEEQEEEEEEGDEEDDEDDEEAEGDETQMQEDSDEDEPVDENAEARWQLPKKYLKLPVSEAARKAAEQMSSADRDRKAGDLARFALFSEYRRSGIKREDISKKVLGKDHARLFPVIFNRAQKILRHTFGYELAQVRARGADNEQIAAAAAQSQRKRPANEEQDDASKKGPASKSFILVSALPAGLIAQLTSPDKNLQQAFEHDFVQDEDEITARDPNGVLLDWQRSGSSLGGTGLTHLILSLILLNGRVLPDDQLRSYLRRFHLLPRDTRSLPGPLPRALKPALHLRSVEGDFTIEDFLTMLVKQDYLERIKVQNAQTTTSALEASLSGKRMQARGQVRRNRRSNNDSDTAEEFEWRWGSRAESEISEEAVAAFVTKIFMCVDNGDDPGEWEESDGGAEQGSDAEQSNQDEGALHRKRRRKQLHRDIQRAAGSTLIA